MMTVIVDTNVALVASSKMDKTSRICELACIDRIELIMMGEVKLALDDQRRIIDEYRRKLNPDGQPGVGDAFLKWVEINWANPERCVRVPITPIEIQKWGLKNSLTTPNCKSSTRTTENLSPLPLPTVKIHLSSKPRIDSGGGSETHYVEIV